MSHSSLRRAPVIGDRVYWYRQGDRAALPIPAIVTKVESGVLKLTAFPCYCEQIFCTNVHHMSDKALLTNPAVAQDYGGWDFMPEAGLDEALAEISQLRDQIAQLREQVARANSKVAAKA